MERIEHDDFVYEQLIDVYVSCAPGEIANILEASKGYSFKLFFPEHDGYPSHWLVSRNMRCISRCDVFVLQGRESVHPSSFIEFGHALFAANIPCVAAVPKSLQDNPWIEDACIHVSADLQAGFVATMEWFDMDGTPCLVAGPVDK